MLRSVALTVALVLGVASSPGAKAQECERPAFVLAMTKAQLPDLQWKLYAGAEAQKIVAIWNAAPPASDDKADTVVLMRSQIVPGAVGVLLISAEGCVTQKGSLPAGELDALKLSEARGA